MTDPLTESLRNSACNDRHPLIFSQPCHLRRGHKGDHLSPDGFNWSQEKPEPPKPDGVRFVDDRYSADYGGILDRFPSAMRKGVSSYNALTRQYESRATSWAVSGPPATSGIFQIREVFDSDDKTLGNPHFMPSRETAIVYAKARAGGALDIGAMMQVLEYQLKIVMYSTQGVTS